VPDPSSMSTPVPTGKAGTPTPTTAPAPSPAGAVDSQDTPAGHNAGGDAGGGSAGTSLSGGSARRTPPFPTSPDRGSEKHADEARPQAPPDPPSSPRATPLPPGCDIPGLGGLLGVHAGDPPDPGWRDGRLDPPRAAVDPPQPGTQYSSA
jgi:hypothetical protein